MSASVKRTFKLSPQKRALLELLLEEQGVSSSSALRINTGKIQSGFPCLLPSSGCGSSTSWNRAAPSTTSPLLFASRGRST
jgi:hypothetical protein